MASTELHVLFLCTGNSARSILAEALLNHRGAGRFVAHSAGSQPKGQVHPFAIELLSQIGLSTQGLRSKSWDEFAQADAPRLDYVFTVCGNAAGEVCPVWQGGPVTAHWGIDDPAAVDGTDEIKRAAFKRAAEELETRINLFLSLPLDLLDRIRLKDELDAIGQTPTSKTSS